MRRCWAWSLFLLAACGDSSTGPTIDHEPEVPRGSFELLVESFGPGGRSFVTMSPDGNFVLPFAGLPADATSPIPSPGGRTIAFLRATSEGDVHLWRMDRWSKESRLLLGGTRLVNQVAWSSDGTRLAISGSTFEESDDIWVLDADGSGLRNIASDPKPAIVTDRHPTWSPDGQSIAFQSNRDGLSRVWIMDADGSDPRRILPDLDTVQLSPAWAPDGSRVAFVDPAVGVAWSAPDGTGYRAVGIPHRPENLAWTRDGMLLFSASNGIDAEIYGLDPASGTFQNLTRHPSHDVRATELAWVEPPSWRGFGAVAWFASGRSTPARLVAADLIADGRPDLVVLEAGGNVSLLRATGSGEFVPAGTLDGAGEVRDTAAADVSRDGFDDLLVLTADAIAVWRGGESSPGAMTTHPLGGQARGLVVGDFDADGSSDVAGIHDGDGQGFHMLVHGASTSDGSLVAILDYSSTFPEPGLATAGDVDGDANTDVVVMTLDLEGPWEAPIVLVPGQGDISFGAASPAASGISNPAGAVPWCVDLDGDRRDDLILTTAGGAVSWLASQGRTFAMPARIDDGIVSLAAGDVDGDGDADLVAAILPEERVVFLRNRGNGEFASPVTVAAGVEAIDVVLVDLDGDAWLDVAVVDAEGRVGVASNRRR